MAEDQAGLLGRRVMQLEMENENLNKQLEEKVQQQRIWSKDKPTLVNSDINVGLTAKYVV